MASLDETNGSAFPAADADKELNPGNNKEFEVDSRSAQVAKDREQVDEKKNEAENAAKKRKEEKKDAIEKLKSTIIVSAIVVALAGAVYAISKKLKEK